MSASSDSISFTDTSKLQLGSISQWIWEFWGWNRDNRRNPVHTYAAPGTYKVKTGSSFPIWLQGFYYRFRYYLSEAKAGLFCKSGMFQGFNCGFVDTSQISSVAIANWDWGSGWRCHCKVAGPQTFIYRQRNLYRPPDNTPLTKAGRDTFKHNVIIYPKPVRQSLI